MYQSYNPSDTVRTAPIRVVRVVVVDVARRVDIPRIVGVATIARAQPHIDRGRTAYSLYKESDTFVPVFILLMPSFYGDTQVTNHRSPMLHLAIAQMEMLSAKLNLRKMFTT